MPESPKNRVRGSILGPTSPGRLRVVLVQSLWCVVLIGFPEQRMWDYFTSEMNGC